MFRSRQIIILLSIIVALSLLLLFGLILQNTQRGEGAKPNLLSSAFTKDSIVKLDIAKPIGDAAQKTLISLFKQNDTWFVTEAGVTLPARTSRITDLASALSTLVVEREVSNQATSYPELGLEDAKAIVVEVQTSSGARETLLFGKRATNKPEQYLRRAQSERSLSVGSQASFYLDQEGRYWSERKLFPQAIDEKQVKGLTLNLEKGQTISIQRSEDPASASPWALAVGSLKPELSPMSLVNDTINLEGDRMVVLEADAKVPSGYSKDHTRTLELVSGEQLLAVFYRHSEAGLPWLAVLETKGSRTPEGRPLAVELPDWKIARASLDPAN